MTTEIQEAELRKLASLRPRDAVMNVLARMENQYIPDEKLVKNLVEPILAQCREEPDWAEIVGYDLASMLAIKYLTSGQVVPEPLNEFVVGVLELKVKRKERGPSPFKNMQRDAAIRFAIRAAMATGMHPTRNEATSGESACDLVSDCLRKFGYELGYSGVAKIWTERPDSGV